MVDIDESGNEQDATVRRRQSCIDCGRPLHPRRRKRCGHCQEAHIRDMARKYQRKKQQRHEPIEIPMDDPLVHTDEQPFCNDPDCPCHAEE